MQSDRRASPSTDKPTAEASPTKAPPSPSRDAAAAPPPPETVVYGESEFTGGDIAGKYGLLVKGSKRRRGGDAAALTAESDAAPKEGDGEEPYDISTAPRDAPLLTKGRGELDEAIQDLPEHIRYLQDYEAKPIADFNVAVLRERAVYPALNADAHIDGKATGAMSYALLKSLRANPGQSYAQLLASTRAILSKEYSQIPQLSSGHEIDMNAVFVL
ncbi:Ca(2+)-dependent cysteine protease [Blastocladiella emersonii ATCC 22665]|nr:Ca(2+)-dependent cysteine protease [Blastocladiella emersonii ATCC 22665]